MPEDETKPPKQLQPATIVVLTVAFAILSIAFNYCFMKASRQMRTLVPNSQPLFTSTHLKSRFASPSSNSPTPLTKPNTSTTSTKSKP